MPHQLVTTSTEFDALGSDERSMGTEQLAVAIQSRVTIRPKFITMAGAST
jgi:hypothetical protein